MLVLPGVAQGATVTLDGTTLRFDAVAGETNTGVIAAQGAGVYFVGDLSGPTPTATGLLVCVPAPSPLPQGLLCTAPTASALAMNLRDGNDTGVTSGPPGTINGGTGNDTLVGGPEQNTFTGGADSDTVAYAGVADAGISRTATVTATLPDPGGGATSGNGETGENDTIQNDIEGLVGGNGNDTLTGGSGADTIAGAAPAGTPNVDTAVAGVDTIDGKGGADTLLGGDSGSVTGGAGADQIVGGRSATATTVIHGGPTTTRSSAAWATTTSSATAASTRWPTPRWRRERSPS